MKFAFITDIHGDLPALDDALRQIQRLGVDQIVCLGDMIDGDAFSQEVIDRLRAEGIPCLRGNHERWRARPAPAPRIGRTRSAPSSVGMTYDEGDIFGSGVELTGDSMSWLGALATGWGIDVGDVRVRATHARPGSDMAGVYPERLSPAHAAALLDEAGADILVVGHTHERWAIRSGARLICNPGALWRGAGGGSFAVLNADGKFESRIATTGGTFGVLELPARRFTVHRASDGAVLLDSGKARSPAFSPT